MKKLILILTLTIWPSVLFAGTATINSMDDKGQGGFAINATCDNGDGKPFDISVSIFRPNDKSYVLDAIANNCKQLTATTGVKNEISEIIGDSINY